MKTVSVDELKEWVFNWFEKNRYYHPYSKGNDIPISELYDILKQMPSAEKHGKWISNTGGFSCSNCGHQTDDDEIGNWDITFGKWVYCPHCGAQMERSEDA